LVMPLSEKFPFDIWTEDKSIETTPMAVIYRFLTDFINGI
jgi:hypothetical protein